MNYQKIDGPLAMAIEQIQDLDDPVLLVFINTGPNLSHHALELLQSFGMKDLDQNREIFTATLSVNHIDFLSEASWVEYLRLSQKLNTLKGK